MVDIVLIGDEMGLKTLAETLGGRSDIRVRAIIYNPNRERVAEIVDELANILACVVIGQPQKTDKKGNDEFAEKIRRLQTKMAVCFSYDRIIPLEILDLFPQGVFNLHGAMLPKYRGANVLNWVLVNGETETGVTIHRMEETVDTGPIVMQRIVPIDHCDTALTLREKMNDASKELLRDFWDAVAEERITETPQDENKATSVSRRHPEDGFFDWSWESERIYNLIRALVRPWPGAWYLSKDGEKHIIDQFMTYEEVCDLKEQICGCERSGD